MDREGGYARCSACFLEIYGDLIMFAIHLVRRLFAYFHGVLSAYTKYEVTFRLQPRFRYAYSLKRRREARGKVALSCSRLQSHVTVLFLCVFFSFAGPIIRDPGLHVCIFSGKCHQADSISRQDMDGTACRFLSIHAMSTASL